MKYVKILLSALLFSLIFLSWAQDPPDISLVFYLEEHSPNGTLVGTVTGTDPNGDPLTYSIVSGNGTGAFDINSTTGDVFVANESELIFEVNPSFVLGVEADDGNGGVTSVEITINLIDVPLGFDDSEHGILIYPNPVSEFLYVDVKTLKLGESDIWVYSMNGERLKVPMTINSDSKMEMNLNSVKKGVYLLQVRIEDQFLYSRIFVR